MVRPETTLLVPIHRNLVEGRGGGERGEEGPEGGRGREENTFPELVQAQLQRIS